MVLRTITPPSLLFMLVLFFVIVDRAYAVDAENCLMCHRFRGLARVDKDGMYRLFHVDETLFSQGPHARVNCTGCHVDVNEIPARRCQAGRLPPELSY
jgi:hypothetical protein